MNSPDYCSICLPRVWNGQKFLGMNKDTYICRNKSTMVLNSQVSSFALEDVALRLKTDVEGFLTDFSAFSEKNLTLMEAGIGIDRKVLYVWKKQGLLPHTGLPKKEGKDKNWGRFSFIELCWIRVLMEYRAMGVGIEMLKQIKDFFYPKGFFEAFFDKPIENLNESLDSKTLELIKEKNLINDNQQIVLTKEIIDLFDQIQFSLFSCLLYATMLSKRHFLLYLDSKGKIDAIDLDEILKDPVMGVMNFHNLLSQESSLFVNIRKIIAELSGTHEHFSKNLNIGQMMSDSSVSFLRDLFKDGQVKEVTFRVSETGRPLVIIRKEMSMEDLEKEVRKVRKKGNYFDLLVKTRDGDVKYFEHTEIIKL